MIAGLILAAGKSERMGSPKALLPYREGTFLSTLYTTFSQSPLGAVRVVVGHDASNIIECSGLPREVFVVNPEYEQGMLTSIQAGLRALEDLAPEALVLCPVDHPAVPAGMIGCLMEAFRAGGRSIVAPVFDRRRGHPVLFGSRLFGEILSAPLEVGARALLQAHPEEVLEVEAADGGVLLDIDTPEDLRALRERGA